MFYELLGVQPYYQAWNVYCTDPVAGGTSYLFIAKLSFNFNFNFNLVGS